MKTAYIFHDAFCDPFSEWYPWMKTTLESKGYLVIVPKFPSPAGQSYESWKVVIKNYINTFDSDTIIIGHGTGGVFGLRIVQELTQKIQGLFLVASYGEPIGNIGYDRINKTFYEPALDWKKIKEHAITIRIFAGDQDPFVPLAITERLAEGLGENVETIPEGGHLGKAAGFTQLVPVASRIFESLSEIDKSITVEKNTDDEIAVLAPIAVNPVAPQQEPISQADKPVHNPELHAHTMYQDMSHLVNSNKGTVASSLLTKARTDKAVADAASPASGKNIMYTLFSIFLIGATLGIVIFLVQKYAPTPTIPPTPEVLSLIKSEEHKKITLSGEPVFLLDQKIRNVFEQPMTDGTIRDIYYVNATGRASFSDLITALGITNLPAGLTDEFPSSENSVPVFMHGLSTKNQVARHFLVIKINNYDITFAFMKQWERTMLKDLGPLMNISSDFLKTRLGKDVFQDELLQNKNVRTLRYRKPVTISLDDTSTAVTSTTSSALDSISSTVQTVLANNPFTNQSAPYQEKDLMISYFFLNEKTLVITDNLELVPELLKRYANSQIYQ
ncbi:MAG: alpha/beta hydrolase [bacterium]